MIEKIIENTKPKYPQPHNIRLPIYLTLDPNREIMKEHGRLKYIAKYQKSKQSKRLYR